MLRRVLVVDDSPMDREFACELLKRGGVEPISAADGAEALERLAEGGVDAVLTDLQMPGIDGLQLVRKMRVEHPGVPAVLMTAYGNESIAAEALEAGAASYVPKQTLGKQLDEALETVGRAVEARRSRRAVRSLLEITESRFVLGYEPDASQALLRFADEALAAVELFDETGRLQVTTALTEALANALEHGNLELDSALREEGLGAYQAEMRRRAGEAPYADRRVRVRMRLMPDRVTYVIRDEGPGFDPSSLPDPRRPENLTKPSGRGIMLIRAFMDVVTFNPEGNQITMTKARAATRA